jgi:EAL domain-containing protein (putative c-di-GMP-specific phosphodiesterase class I)
MPSRARFLGFAFANADFLFEVDGEGTILFAAGAASDLVREPGESLVGRPAARLFRPSEGVKFITFCRALKDGDRAGPHKLILASGDEVQVSLFRLPDNRSRVSCTLVRTSMRASAPQSPAIDAKTGLQSRESFLASAGAATGNDSLTLIDVPGLDELCAKMDPQSADQLMARIGEAFKEAGARSAGRLSETRFGAVAPEADGPLGVARLVKSAIAQGGGGDAAVRETSMSLQDDDISEEQRLLAVRYAIDQFAARGRVPGEGDIATAFGAMLEETQRRLADMTRVVGEGAFEVAFQPIIHLASGKVAHYEALTRFANKGTGESVKFIEALGIAHGFDLAVAGKILSQVEEDERRGVEIAFNVSGATIASPSAFGMLAGMLEKRRKVAPRVLVEITETAAIQDLESAAKAVKALRGMGYRVGLDDFGAGAASINYLHAFEIDFVKFDGGLVKKIGTSKREDALLGGLTKLCAELGVTTIAECIETEAMAKAALALGFDKGQGKYLGAPSLDIEADIVPGRRQGYRESWG